MATTWVLQGFGLGMSVWVLAYGFNRIFLTVKRFLS